MDYRLTASRRDQGGQHRDFSRVKLILHLWPLDLRMNLHFFGFLKNFIDLFLGRGEGTEKERQRNIHVWEVQRSVASRMPPTEDLARNPGMGPDWETNREPFSS